MRLFFLLLSLFCIAAGILFGALNPHAARVDFYWFDIEGSLGALLLLAALLGAAIGGFALHAGVVFPLQRRLRRLRRERAQDAPPPTPPVTAAPLAIGSERP